VAAIIPDKAATDDLEFEVGRTATSLMTLIIARIEVELVLHGTRRVASCRISLQGNAREIPVNTRLRTPT